MNMNNIAIGFEQAEHYTLQEACDYLNLKHNTTNITPKKLIKHIYQRSIKCYVYIQSDYGKDKSYQDKDNCGFGSGADLSDKLNKMFCKPIHPTLDESVKIKERDRENICIVLDMAFSHNFLGRLCSFGLFLMPSDKTLYQLTLPKVDKANCQCFVDCFDVISFGEHKGWDMLLDSSFVMKELAKGKREIYSYTDIRGIELFTQNTDPAEQQKMASFLPFECNINQMGDNFYFEPYIGIDDLIIFDKDLQQLENDIISNAPLPTKQVAGIQPKRGVSPHKIQAKEQAKIIAKVLWNNDKDQKIRVAEMARTVYAELYDCGFDEQLPQNQDSLQDWIREVAPPYAKMGGRPKNEP